MADSDESAICFSVVIDTKCRVNRKNTIPQSACGLYFYLDICQFLFL